MADPADNVLPLRGPPATVARIDRSERWNTGQRWGDLRPSTLGSVIKQAEQGNTADWYDLCDFILRDDLVGSVHQSRVLRVTQNDWVIRPSQYCSSSRQETVAELAAEMCNELVGRIRKRGADPNTVGWQGAQKALLHAIGPGFSAVENAWEHDRHRRMYYVATMLPRHGHRFRYDEQWQHRLYDRGARMVPGSMYGEALRPGGWLVHMHQPNSGYPGTAGQIMQIAWIWLFRRMVDKFHVGGVETAGDPLVYVQVPKNTTRAVRQQILSDLENLANNSVGVLNDDVSVETIQAAAATKSWEAYTTYKTESKERIVTNYLGASDLVAPGENGSQAAVGARTGAMTDPRMVDDGDALSETVQGQLFYWFCYWNQHLLGAPVDQIPLPEMRRKTADDEVKRDPSDRASEIGDERAAAGQGNIDPLTGKPLPGVMPPQLAAHADAAAKAAQAVEVEDAEDPDPKVSARASTRAATSPSGWSTTLATGSRSRSPIERALSSGLVGSGRSSKKRSK